MLLKKGNPTMKPMPSTRPNTVGLGVGKYLSSSMRFRVVPVPLRVGCLQAEWLAFPAITSERAVILMGTSGGNPIVARLAARLIDKGLRVIGIVAMSGTPDPAQVSCYLVLVVSATVRACSCVLVAGTSTLQGCDYHRK